MSEVFGLVVNKNKNTVKVMNPGETIEQAEANVSHVSYDITNKENAVSGITEDISKLDTNASIESSSVMEDLKSSATVPVTASANVVSDVAQGTSQIVSGVAQGTGQIVSDVAQGTGQMFSKTLGNLTSFSSTTATNEKQPETKPETKPGTGGKSRKHHRRFRGGKHTKRHFYKSKSMKNGGKKRRISIKRT